MTRRILAILAVAFAGAFLAFFLTSGMEPGDFEKGLRRHYGVE